MRQPLRAAVKQGIMQLTPITPTLVLRANIKLTEDIHRFWFIWHGNVWHRPADRSPDLGCLVPWVAKSEPDHDTMEGGGYEFKVPTRRVKFDEPLPEALFAVERVVRLIGAC